MKYSRHQGQGGKAKEAPHPQWNKICLLKKTGQGGKFCSFWGSELSSDTRHSAGFPPACRREDKKRPPGQAAVFG